MPRTIDLPLACAMAALLAACGGDGDGAAGGAASIQVETARGSTEVTVNLTPAPDGTFTAPRGGSTYDTSAVRYAFTELGPPTGPYTISTAAAVNRNGQVVGSSRNDDGQNNGATLWIGTVATDLSAPPGTYSLANGINDTAQVAGTRRLDGTLRATRWDGTTAIDLGTPNEEFSQAKGINNAGQVVGSVRVSDREQATVWSGTTATTLSTLGGPTSQALAISNAGRIVGYGNLASTDPVRQGMPHAALWQGTTATDLGIPFGGEFSKAYGVNDAGQAVGISSRGATLKAVVWNGTTAVDLSIAGARASEAFGINARGQVVGSEDSSGFTHATVWNDAVATDLNALLDPRAAKAGWVLVSAEAINDQGTIVGNAFNSSTTTFRAYVLTPLTDKAQCMDGGWERFGFPNQGQCIQFANTGK